MFIKDPYSLLAEAAYADMTVNTEAVLTESEIYEKLDAIEEIDEEVVYPAQSVAVMKIGESMLTEMFSLAPFMKSNGITSVAEALNIVAEANGLPEKSVGLLIESDQYTNMLLEKAKAKKKKGDKDGENKVLDKIKSATELPKKLKDEGFPVKKKKGKGKKSKKKSNNKKKKDEEF